MVARKMKRSRERKRSRRKSKRRKRSRKSQKGGFFCSGKKRALQACKRMLAGDEQNEEILKKVIDDMVTEEEQIINIIKKHKNEPGVQKVINDIKKISGSNPELLELLK
tara:strand:+ start:727 stop:1053 length:327 start_codon:yes stop_codon:yes gene_type:complete